MFMSKVLKRRSYTCPPEGYGNGNSARRILNKDYIYIRHPFLGTQSVVVRTAEGFIAVPNLDGSTLGGEGVAVVQSY